MAHAHFTARWVAAVPAPPQGQVDYFDQTPPSLGLRVAPSGRKTWFVMYRAHRPPAALHARDLSGREPGGRAPARHGCPPQCGPRG